MIYLYFAQIFQMRAVLAAASGRPAFTRQTRFHCDPLRGSGRQQSGTGGSSECIVAAFESSYFAQLFDWTGAVPAGAHSDTPRGM